MARCWAKWRKTLAGPCLGSMMSPMGLVSGLCFTLFAPTSAGRRTRETHWSLHPYQAMFQKLRAVMLEKCDGNKERNQAGMVHRACEVRGHVHREYRWGDRGSEAEHTQGCMEVGGRARSETNTVSFFCYLLSSRTDHIAAISKYNCFHPLILTLSQDNPSEIESQGTCPPVSAGCRDKHPVSSTILFPARVARFRRKKNIAE